MTLTTTTPRSSLLLVALRLTLAICIMTHVPLANAQSGPQAALIPPCVKTCDPPAIASVNCTLADQYCHCVRQDGLLRNISACAEKGCEEPGRDLFVFTTLFQDVCQKFNISVPVLGSNGTANTTLSPAVGNSTAPAPYVGSASGLYGSNNNAAWTSLAGLSVFVVALGTLL